MQFKILGILELPTPPSHLWSAMEDLIDVDEFGVTLEKCNCTERWAVKVLRVWMEGHYHHSVKMTVIIAIEPRDPALPPNVC